MLQVFASRVAYAWHHTSHHLRGHAFNIVHSSSLLLTSRYTSRVRLAQVKTRPRCPCVCVSVSVSVLVKRLTRTCKREVGSNVFGRARLVFGMPPICLIVFSIPPTCPSACIPCATVCTVCFIVCLVSPVSMSMSLCPCTKSMP